MVLKLYDLSGKNDIRFSPYCWTIKLCLIYKKLKFQTIPIRFTEKNKIAFSGQKLVPILVTKIDKKENIVFDSWNIICWLDKINKNDKNIFFKDDNLKTFSYFLYQWTSTQLLPILFEIIANDIPNILEENDVKYFISSREKRLGKPLSSLLTNIHNTANKFRKLINPIRKILESQSYLNGKEPSILDFIFFGNFIWAEKCSEYKILDFDEMIDVG